ncbi:MAG TPA: hypothetical protein PLO23_07015 [Alphaproteobacteria bacterium]|nr:hypothetical protein [Alphaproteobacteria bacterium]
MIAILGFKRVVTLAVLVGLNVLMALGIYYYLQPHTLSLEQQLAGAKGQVSTVQADIEKILVEFDMLEKQKGDFNALKERGFLSSQGRRQAEIVLGDIQRQSQVVSATANVRAASVEENEIAAKAEHTVLTSPVEIKVQALDDIDIYRYVTLLSQKFPGHLSIDDVSVKRTTDVSNPILRGIAVGENVPMVEAEFKMKWRTLVSKLEAERILKSAVPAPGVRP